MISIASCTNIDSPKNNNKSSSETSSIFSENKSSESNSGENMDVTIKGVYDRLDNKTHKDQLIKKSIL